MHNLSIFSYLHNVKKRVAPCAEALDTESPKSNTTKTREKCFRREINIFFMSLHYILYAGRCNNFRWFPHTPKPPRPLTRPQHCNLHVAAIVQLSFLGLLFRIHFGLWYTLPCRGHELALVITFQAQLSYNLYGGAPTHAVGCSAALSWRVCASPLPFTTRSMYVALQS